MRRTAAVVLLGLAVAAQTLLGAGVAGAQPAAVPTAPPTAAPAPLMSSGAEGTKAALVRVETSAVVEIVHINNSTGSVVLARGRYTVPLGAGTGVLLSSEGVIATASRNVQVDDNRVAVYAANQLFSKELKAQLVGNHGDPALPAMATDPELDQHLHHCYQRVEHCVLFTVPEYQVFPYTNPESSARAELVNQPSGPADTALLRIAGGGGTPTAQLRDANAPAPSATSLMGFTEKPGGPDRSAATVSVDVNGTTNQITRPADLNGQLFNGLAGGPVVDEDSGDVLGLATVAGNGTPTLIPASALHQALAAAGVQPTGSPFDTVFRRGVDHLVHGGMGDSATGAFSKSLEYYDSALAAQYLQRAQAQGGAPGQMPMAEPSAAPRAPGGGGPWVLGALVVVLLLGGGGALALHARRSGSRSWVRLHSLASRVAPWTRSRAQPEPLPTASDPPDRVRTGRVRTGRAASTSASASTSSRRGAAVATTSPAEVDLPAPSNTNGSRPAYCTDCGAPLTGRGRFCGACGTPVE